MKKFSTTFAKNLFITILLIIVDVTIKYIIEETHLIQVKPRSIPNNGGAHLENILDMILWISVTLSPLYFLAAILYHQIKLRTSHFTKILHVLIGGASYFLFAYSYIMFAEGGRIDMILSSLLTSPFVGWTLVLLNNYFFKQAHKN